MEDRAAGCNEGGRTRALWSETPIRKSGPLVYSGGRVFDHGQETEAAAAARLFASLGLPSFSFMPQMEYLRCSYLALHEYIGLLYYRLAWH